MVCVLRGGGDQAGFQEALWATTESLQGNGMCVRMSPPLPSLSQISLHDFTVASLDRKAKNCIPEYWLVFCFGCCICIIKDLFMHVHIYLYRYRILPSKRPSPCKCPPHFWWSYGSRVNMRCTYMYKWLLCVSAHHRLWPAMFKCPCPLTQENMATHFGIVIFAFWIDASQLLDTCKQKRSYSSELFVVQYWLVYSSVFSCGCICTECTF